METQPAVDDAQDYQGSAVPYMSVGDETALLVLDIITMVEITTEWLNAEERDHNGAEKSMALLEILRLQSASV